MKKTLAGLLTVLLLMSLLVGCGTKSGERTPAPSPAAETPAPVEETPAPAEETPAPAEETPAPAEETPAPAEETPAGPCAPEGSVIFEKDGVTVTTAGLDYDPTSGSADPIIWVDIENTGDQDACLGVTGGSVNGFSTDVLLVEFYREDGEYYGASYNSELVIPAGSSGRYALGYYKVNVPGVDMGTLSELSFCFTTAEDEYTWYDYISDPVTIVTGEAAEDVDLASLGTVVAEDDELLLVLGEQDYDDWFGPEVYVYVENRSDHYIALSAESADADGVHCYYIYYGASVAPGRKAAGRMSFEGEVRLLRGFETLDLCFSLRESDTAEELGSAEARLLDPVTVEYPPQIWGEYENGGLSLSVRPRYNDLITVETPENGDGIFFNVYETASLEAGGYEGAGWLFSIGKVSEDTLHGLLCSDMSGAEVFARDEEGSYYVYYHPTDVRLERETPEEMESGFAQWAMLCEWAETVKDSLISDNGLENASFGNSEINIYMARAAWMEGLDMTLRSNAFGPLAAEGVESEPYASYVAEGWFWPADGEEFSGGEFVSLSFPEEEVRLDFFYAEGGYVRLVSGENETLYQAAWEDDKLRYVEVMEGWYYALAELQGLKPSEEGLEAYCGAWYEKIAGRGVVEIEKSLAPDRAEIRVRWPESAAIVNTWEMTARLEDGRLCYENGEWNLSEYDEDGTEWFMDGNWEESGWFFLNEEGELLWHNDRTEDEEDSVFIR